jgi:hypothetical protein
MPGATPFDVPKDGGETGRKLRDLKKEGLLRGKKGKEGLDLLVILDKDGWTPANKTFADLFIDSIEASSWLVKEMEYGMEKGDFDDWKCKKMRSLIAGYNIWGTLTPAQIGFANKMLGDPGRR